MPSVEISKKVLKDALKGALAASAVGATTGFSVGTSAGSSLVGPGGIGATKGGIKGALAGLTEGATKGLLGSALLSAGARAIEHGTKSSSTGLQKKLLLATGVLSALGGLASLATVGPSTVRKSFEGAQRDLQKEGRYLLKVAKLKRALRG